MIIPESRYHDLFDRINSILYEQEFTEDDRKFYLLLNAICFGPVVSFLWNLPQKVSDSLKIESI